MYMNNNNAIYFMPYLRFCGDQTIDQFRFFNYEKFKEKYVKDIKVRKYLDTSFSHFIDVHKKPISGITVVTHEKTGFLKSWKNETLARCRTVINCIAFEFIRNRYENELQQFVTENFILDAMKFNPDSDRLSYTSGSYYTSTDFGLKLNDSYFQRPLHIPSHRMLKIANLFGDGISCKVTKALLICQNEKIHRAVRLFNQIHYNYDQQDEEFRLFNTMFLWTTLEMLSGKCGRKDIIINTMKKLFTEWFKDGKADFSGLKSNEKLKIDTDNEFLKKFFDWISSFYELRNDYFHGKPIVSSKLEFDHQSHPMIARAVLAELIEKELEDAGEHIRSLSKTSKFQFHKFFDSEYDYQYEGEKNLDPRSLELARQFIENNNLNAT